MQGEVVKLVYNSIMVNELRLRKGMTKKDLATAAGLSLNVITAATSGRPIGVVAAKKVAKALGVGINDLIERFSGGESSAVAAVG